MTERKQQTPEKLLQIKQEISEGWSQLPPEHQASMALVFLQEVLGDDYGQWIADAIELHAVATIGQQVEPEKPPQQITPEYLDSIRGMELLPDELREQLPPLYANEELGLKAPAVVKYFTPDSNWTWYGSEFDGEDLFFGLVSGFEIELGYFSLSEIRGAQGPMGLPVERDLYFKSKILEELKTMHQQERQE